MTESCTEVDVIQKNEKIRIWRITTIGETGNHDEKTQTSERNRIRMKRHGNYCHRGRVCVCRRLSAGEPSPLETPSLTFP